MANLSEGRPNKTTEISAPSQSDAAAMLNVSTDSIQFARKVLDQGSEELIRKVDRGEITVRTTATNKSLTILTKSIYIS